MPYLNLDLNYEDHPKTRRLIALLGPEGDVFPIRLWLYCGKIHPRDGALMAYSAQEIEGLIGWHGEPNKAVEALKKIGFLKEAEKGLICKDWRQHQGHLISFSRRAKRANKLRWARVRKASLKDAARNPPSVPIPIPIPNQLTTDRAHRTFVKPSVEEIRTYCMERQNGIDAQHFFDYYEAAGWMRGKSKIKNWRACVATWERNDRNAHGRIAGHAAPTGRDYDVTAIRGK